MITKQASTRLLRLAALPVGCGALCAFALVGCVQNKPTTLNALLAPEPQDNLVFANTTQPVRNWSRSSAVIANGDTVGTSTGARFQTKDGLSTYAVAPSEVGVFVANVVTLPYTLIEQRGKVVSSGLQFPPTYNAMPPVPPSATDAPEPWTVEMTPWTVENQPWTVQTQPWTVEMEPWTAPALPPSDTIAPTTAPADMLERTTTQPDVPQFTISGQVLRPGNYATSDKSTLTTVIRAAGPASEDAKKIGITIERAGEQPASTTFDQLLAGAVDDIVVKPGDVITISIVP